MATKFLVVETPDFQLGANAGPSSERISPDAFPARLKAHFASKEGELLFVLAPAELRYQAAFADAPNGEGPVSIAFFSSQNDAIRFLPSLLAFDGADRSGGAKEFLAKGSTIYSETFFNGNAAGTRLDPCFTFARSNLAAAPAASAWACLQSLVFVGLQNLPDVGEKGTGEKVDVQLGADEKVLVLTVRFNLAPEKFAFLRANPILTLPRSCAGAFELRFVAEGGQAELTCVFFRAPTSATERTVEITSWQASSALESGQEVKSYDYRTFGGIAKDEAPVRKTGGFKKKFSEQVRIAGGAPEAESISVISAGTVAPYNEPKVVVSGNAGLAPDKETIFKNENAANRVIELEAKLKDLEAQLKTRDDLLAKSSKEQSDPLKKRDVLTNIKDSQSEALKQTVKNLETELEEAKGREMELMKMVDKAVQMKDEAAKKIKELDLKLKSASNGGGSKIQMLEKALDEQKRQNKELSKRVSELNDKLKAA